MNVYDFKKSIIELPKNFENYNPMAKWFALEWGNVKEINPSTKDSWKQSQGVSPSGEGLGLESLLPTRSKVQHFLVQTIP